MSKVKKGYKDTEFGIIPNDWNIDTFGNLLEGFTSGATPYRAIPSFYNGDILWISSGELNYNWITDTIEHISLEAQRRTNLKKHPVGTFLMAITGLEAEGTRGRCAFVGNPATTNQSCLAIYPTARLTTEYLFYFYRQYANYLAFKYCQGTKQQSYTAKIAKQLPICCPSDVQEQQAIAEVLSDIDALINALNKQIEKKKYIKQGAMQELLTGKKRLKGFSSKWKKIKLEDIAKSINTGNKNNEEQTEDGRYPFFVRSQKICYINSYSFDGEAILIPGEGGIGNIIHYINGKFDYHQRVYKISDFVNTEAKFVYYNMMILFAEHANKNSVKATVDSLRLPTFLEYEMFIPSTKEEQTAIAQVLTDMDNEIEQLEKKRDKYLNIKSGMMQQLLTGQIRLTAD